MFMGKVVALALSFWFIVAIQVRPYFRGRFDVIILRPSAASDALDPFSQSGLRFSEGIPGL